MADLIDGNGDRTLSRVFGWIAAVLGFGFMAIFLFAVVQVARVGVFDDLVLQHVPCTVGLPCAAMASLILVLILRTVAGNIELKVLGFEFKGASGPIIMWILCFLAMTLAINKTWDLKYEHPRNTDKVFIRP